MIHLITLILLFITFSYSVENINVYLPETHVDEIQNVAISEDEMIVATAGGGNDNAIGLWNLKTGNFIKMLLGHSASIKE